jgi:hypothetical protein
VRGGVAAGLARGGGQSPVGMPRDAGAGGARSGTAALQGAAGGAGGVAPGGGAESGAAWAQSPAAKQVTILKAMKCRRSSHVLKLLPAVPKVSSTSIALPAADAPRDSGGRLTQAAADLWCGPLRDIASLLKNSSVLKDESRKKRMSNLGIVQNFCTLAGFGTYFKEVSPGVWEPARDESGDIVPLREEFIAFMLSCMANGGLARRADGPNHRALEVCPRAVFLNDVA